MRMPTKSSILVKTLALALGLWFLQPLGVVAGTLTLTSGLTLDRPTNLITNGSFESGGPGIYWATGTTNLIYSPLPSWTSAGGALNYAQRDDTAVSHASAPLADGTHGLYFGNAFVSAS